MHILGGEFAPFPANEHHRKDQYVVSLKGLLFYVNDVF